MARRTGVAVLRIRVCGGLEVEHDGALLPDALVGGRQGRLVLAYLACERHRPVSRDELAELLWPAVLPDSWSASLSAVVSRLRRMLAEAGLDGPTTLLSAAGSYQLLLPAGSVVDLEELVADVERAEAAVEAGDPKEAVERAASAEAVASKGFLADDCEWVDRQRTLVGTLRVRALLARSAAHCAAGAPHRGVEAAREAVSLAPSLEAAYRQLMRSLAAAGERGEALRVWERCRTTLVEELGVDPAPETEALYLEILDAGASTGAGTGTGATPQPPAVGTAGHPTPALPSGVVTFLLTDIVGSSSLWEQHPAAMAAALERHDQLVAEVVAAHDGALLKSKLEGDATVSVFARATACVTAALALADALAAEPWPEGAAPTLRMAVHTGEAFERGGDYFGPALNRAARLRSLAEGGQVVLSQAVAEVVRDHLPEGVELHDLGFRELRGLTRGENVFALGRAGAPAPPPEAAVAQTAPPGRVPLVVPALPPALVGDGPFVGRDDELAQLEALWERAAGGDGRAVFIGGEPGVGKSRLASELAARAHASGGLVLYGRCDEDLAAPLQPFIEAMRTLGPVLGADRLRAVRGVEELARVTPELAELLPDATSARVDPDSERLALFDAVTQVLCAASGEVPVLLVLDDLHWAGKTTLSLLRHVLRGARGARVLVVGTYRDTELGRSHPLAATLSDLRRDGGAERVSLGGLGTADVVAYLAAVGNENRAFGRELAEVTSGNPFFLIEVVRHIDETGGSWEPGSLPEGVREATGRRLSRLSDGTNEALTVAAVVGASFDLALVEQVRGTELLDEIAEACQAGLVVEEPGAPDRFRFAHALVRQVLLGELVTLKRVRLHRTIAELLEAAPDADHDAHLVDLAHHWYECASTGSAAKAVDACRRAADRAMERLAYEEAGDLYGMALQALENAEVPDPDVAATLHLARCDALLTAGDVAGARGAIDALEHAARGSERLSAWYATYEGLLAVLAEPDRLTEIVQSIGAAASAMRAVGDLPGEAKAHYVHASALERLGQIGAAERALDAALAAARAAGDRRLADAILAEAPPAALWGPRPVTRASGSCLDVVRVLRITKGAPAVEAVALRCQAVLEALRGRADAARRMVGSARRTVERLGLAHRLLETEVAAGFIELLDGDAGAAESYLRGAFEALRDRGLDGEAAQAAAFLGRALLLQERYEEADAVAAEAAELAGSDLKAGIAWRDVRAEAAVARGDVAGARALAEESVALATATDALLLVADARITLATVLHSAGDHASARAELQRAIEACEAKGATAMLARVRAGQPDAGSAPAIGAAAPSERHAPPPSVGGRGRLVHTNALRFQEAANAHDYDGVAALRTPHQVVDDRRRVLRTVIDAGVEEDQLSFVLGGGASFDRPRLVEARGERVALHAWVLRSPDFEVPYYAITRTDAWGRNDEYVMFDEDDLDTARAALDEVAARAVERRFDNDSVISGRRRAAAYNADDREGVLSGVAEGLTLEDRRSLFRGHFDRDEYLANNRLVVEGGGRFDLDVVATRGRSLSLTLWRLHIPGADADGDVLVVVRTDEGGDDVRSVIFDADDLDGATSELDAAYVAHEGAAHAALVGHLVALAAERRVRVVHLPRLSDSAALWVVADEAGDERVEVLSHDGTRVTGVERFALDAFDEALVRFEAGASTPARRDGGRGRVVMGVVGRIQAAIERGDYDAMDLEHTSGGAQEDRRRVFGAHSGVDNHQARYVFAKGARLRSRVVEARGERVALLACCLEGDGYEVPYLAVARTDVTGRMDEYVLFDEDDEGAARAWLDAAAARAAECAFDNDAVTSMRRRQAAHEARDVDAVLDGVADGYSFEDRRALFRGVFDRDAYAAQTRLVVEGGGRSDVDVLATRGRSVALARWRLDIPGAGADAEVLASLRVGGDGRDERSVLFDGDDLEEAIDELDRMYAATEGIAHAPLLENLGALATERGLRVVHLPRLSEVAAVWVVADAAGERWVELLAHDGARVTGVERFALDALDDALVRFEDADGRYDTLAVRAERRVQRAYNERDPDAIRAMYADGYVQDDRRSVIRMSLDREQAVAGAQFIYDGRGRFERETIATRGEHLVLARWILTLPDDQAVYPVLIINEFDDDERYVRTTMFDDDDLAGALAALDEAYTAQAQADRIVDNDACRLIRRMKAVLEARDWEGFLAILAPGFAYHDSRAGVQLDLRGEEAIETYRTMVNLDQVTFDREVLATRGRRLVLSRDTVTFLAGAAGPAEIVTLTLTQCDEQGRQSVLAFAADDVDPALAELDRRHIVLGEPAPPPDVRPSPVTASLLANRAWRTSVAWVDAANRRDRQAFDAVFAPGHAMEDRRTTIGKTPVDGQQASIHAIVFELDAYAETRELLATRGDDLALARTLVRFRSGASGSAEIECLTLIEVDSNGRVRREVWFDADDVAAAHDELDRRYLALGDLDRAVADHARRVHVAAPEPFGNLAWRTAERVIDACNRRDRDAVRACHHPDYEPDDRRAAAPAGLIRGGAAEGMATFDVLFALDDFTYEHSLLATRGDRLALVRDHVAFVDGIAGPAEVEVLSLIEVDDRGLVVRNTAFDVHRASDAHDALDARFVELGGPDMRGYRHAYDAQDWDRFASFFSPSFVLVDERVPGWGRLDLDRFLTSQRLVTDIAPDARLWVDHVLARTPEVSLLVGRGYATNDGGDVEWPLVSLTVVGPDQRIASMRFYDLEDLDRARACFDLLTVPWGNAAWRTAVTLTEAVNRRDRDTILACYTPDAESEDRRPGIGNVAAGIGGPRSYLVALEMDDYEEERELLATRGEHLALSRTLVRFRTGASGPAEIEVLTLVEVDTDGLVVREVWFGADDLAAAHDEMDARYGMAGVSQRALATYDARDWGGFADLFRLETLVDHRTVGWGELDREGFVELQRHMTDLSPDARLWIDHKRTEGPVDLFVCRAAGTREGGRWERDVISVGRRSAGRNACVDIYDIDDVEAAQARFRELVEESRRPVPNRAWLAAERLAAAFAARDWEAHVAGIAPGHVNEDRRPGMRHRLEGDAALASTRTMFDMDAGELEQRLLATAGDRLALVATTFRGSDGAVGDVELEVVNVYESAEDGRMARVLLFAEDAEDEARAYMAVRAADIAPRPNRAAELVARHEDAFARRDRDAYEAAFAANYQVVDRQHHAGVTLDPEQAMATNRYVFDLPTVRWERTVLATRGDRLALVDNFVTGGDDVVGGFEHRTLTVVEVDDEGRFVLNVIFEADDLVAAVAELDARASADR